MGEGELSRPISAAASYVGKILKSAKAAIDAGLEPHKATPRWRLHDDFYYRAARKGSEFETRDIETDAIRCRSMSDAVVAASVVFGLAFFILA